MWGVGRRGGESPATKREVSVTRRTVRNDKSHRPGS